MPQITVGATGDYATIQEAIDNASNGDTIVISAGVYNETLDITTDNLTLIGDGAVEINGTFSEDNAAFATSGQSLAEWLKTTGGYTSGADPAVRIAADNVTLHNLTIKDSTWGVELAEGADGAALRHVDLVSNVYGIYKQADSDISGLVLEDGSISDGYVGINFDKAVSGGGASGVTIDGTHFEHLLRKGIYVETLSDALLTNITMEDVGQFGATTFNGPAGAGGNGINLNLKYGNYNNIQITHFTLNDVGASDRDGLDLVGHANGGAIVIAARDDGSYAGDPATLSNVTVANGQITGTTSTAIHVGEPGRDNAGPAVTVNNVTITAITEHSADHGDIANETQATMLVTGTFGDDRMIASGDSDGAFGLFGQFGNDTLGGGSKNDTLDGGLGVDTAVYSSSLTTGDVAFGGSNWTLDGGSEGLDTLISIERIRHGGSGDILLVGGGGYANRAAAEAQKGIADVLLFASTPGAVSDTDGAGNRVDEQAATGTIVGIDAEASTDSAGGSITYSLADDAGGAFTINGLTGVVRVADGTLIDFETAASVQIVVRATNALGAFSDQAFTIDVTDIAPNDAEGGKGKDVLVGTVEPDTISGGGGKDTIDGGGGDDTLDGGKGPDKIDGGSGIDTVSYATSSGSVKVNLGKTKQKGGDAAGDKLKSIENVVGSDKNDKIVGNDADNVLDGAGGNDRLDGKGGKDTLIGGEGDDVFRYKKGYGVDTIADLGLGADVVDITMKGVDKYKDLKALMSEADGNVVIDFGKGDMLILANKTIDSLSKADFHL